VSGVDGSLPPLRGVVRALRVAPVKSLRLLARESLMLAREGVAENRAFYLIDARGRMVNGKRLGRLAAVLADYDPMAARLELRFPDGRRVAGEIRLGERVQTRFFSRAAAGVRVQGPFAAALSEFAGEPLELVRAASAGGGVDRGRRGVVSLISSASLELLSERAGVQVDPRRFRMLVEVEGLAAHEEDLLVGRRARIGEVLVRFNGHAGRCLVTTLNPDTGAPDLPTLDLLAYRRGLETTEPLAFGVFGEVIEPGRVRIGDPLLAP
jgi:uncharacterized protein YcbX